MFCSFGFALVFVFSLIGRLSTNKGVQGFQTMISWGAQRDLPPGPQRENHSIWEDFIENKIQYKISVQHYGDFSQN